jgi:hypothetical protein
MEEPQVGWSREVSKLNHAGDAQTPSHRAEIEALRRRTDRGCDAEIRHVKLDMISALRIELDRIACEYRKIARMSAGCDHQCLRSHSSGLGLSASESARSYGRPSLHRHRSGQGAIVEFYSHRHSNPNAPSSTR